MYTINVQLTCHVFFFFAGLARALWLSLSLCLSVCAMLSKEQGITVIAVCLTYDFFIIQKVITNLTSIMSVQYSE